MDLNEGHTTRAGNNGEDIEQGLREHHNQTGPLQSTAGYQQTRDSRTTQMLPNNHSHYHTNSSNSRVGPGNHHGHHRMNSREGLGETQPMHIPYTGLQQLPRGYSQDHPRYHDRQRQQHSYEPMDHYASRTPSKHSSMHSSRPGPGGYNQQCQTPAAQYWPQSAPQGTSHDYKQEKEATTENHASSSQNGPVSMQSSDRDCRERYSDIHVTESEGISENVNYTRLQKVRKSRNMMGEHTSYHQSIPGDEAERRLKQFGRHCYLTRFSEHHDCYVLSVYQNQKPKDVVSNFKIIIKDDGKNLIDGKDEEFNDIGQLLAHYENHRIDPALKTIGRNCVEEDYLRDEEFRERGEIDGRRPPRRLEGLEGERLEGEGQLGGQGGEQEGEGGRPEGEVGQPAQARRDRPQRRDKLCKIL